jgi:ABC-2 type transport system permease protein
MKKYFSVWFMMTGISFQIFIVSRISTFIFLAGKVFRIVFFLLFLVFLVSKTKLLAGYNVWQILLFYMTFNLIDATTQMLFREVYRFRTQIVNGNFDLVLVKPVNTLFRSLFGWTDLLDFVTIVPFILFIVFILFHIPMLNFLRIFLYLVFIVNAFLIASAFHIFVLSLAVLTTQIDQTLMIYRDVTSMGRIPIKIYQEPIRSIITFVIPVGIMMNFPVDAILGKLPFVYSIIAFMVSFVALLGSILFWNYSLKRYTSASS